MIRLDAGESFDSLADYKAELQSYFHCDAAEVPEVVAGLSNASGVLGAIHEHCRTLREQQSELMAVIETHAGGPLRSEMRRWDALDRRFDESTKFIDETLTHRERIKAEQASLEDGRKHFNQVIRGAKTMEQTELSEWIRHGTTPTFELKLNDWERHDLTRTSAAGAVPLGFVDSFFQHMIAGAGVRQTNATVYNTAGGEPLVIPKSTVDPTAAIVAEGVAITPNDPTLSSVTLSSNAYKELVYVSRELVQDSDINIEEMLGRLMGRAIGTANGLDLVLGNGSSKPQGVLNSPVDGVVTTWALLIAGATGPDLLTDLYFSVNPPYRAQGHWLMNDATLAAIRKLKSTANEYLVDRNLVTAPSETIFGRPVITDPNVLTGAGAKVVIAFGDFSQYYAIRDVNAALIERSDDFRFANDEIAYRAVLRTDGRQVLNDAANSAVKVLRDTA